MVTYGKLNKPSERDCKRYCKDYATCTRTECNRKKMFKENEPIYMGEGYIALKLDYKMAWNNWKGDTECMLNNDTFTRRKLG